MDVDGTRFDLMEDEISLPRGPAGWDTQTQGEYGEEEEESGFDGVSGAKRSKLDACVIEEDDRSSYFSTATQNRLQPPASPSKSLTQIPSSHSQGHSESLSQITTVVEPRGRTRARSRAGSIVDRAMGLLGIGGSRVEVGEMSTEQGTEGGTRKDEDEMELPEGESLQYSRLHSVERRSRTDTN